MPGVNYGVGSVSIYFATILNLMGLKAQPDKVSIFILKMTLAPPVVTEFGIFANFVVSVEIDNRQLWWWVEMLGSDLGFLLGYSDGDVVLSQLHDWKLLGIKKKNKEMKEEKLRKQKWKEKRIWGLLVKSSRKRKNDKNE